MRVCLVFFLFNVLVSIIASIINVPVFIVISVIVLVFQIVKLNLINILFIKSNVYLCLEMDANVNQE